MSIKNFFAPKRPREETAEDAADASPAKKMKTASYVIIKTVHFTLTIYYK